MEHIPKSGDKVILSNDDYYSNKKKGSIGVVECVSVWYWRADIVFEDETRANVHFDNIELFEKEKKWTYLT